MHTWEDSQINQILTQNQAEQDNWLNETQKNCPMKVIQTAMPVGLSLSPSMCLSMGTLFFFLLKNTLFHYFLSLWEFFSATPKS